MPAQGAEPGLHDALYRDMLVGLHAMAQPLTLLQSRLYLVLARGSAPDLQEDLLADAQRDLEALCAVFRSLQGLVHMESVPARLRATPLAEVVAAMVEDAEAVLAGLGIRLVDDHASRQISQGSAIAEPAGAAAAASIHVDAGRMRHALAQLLSLAGECVPTGSSLSWKVRVVAGRTELWIEAQGLPVHRAAARGRAGSRRASDARSGSGSAGAGESAAPHAERCQLTEKAELMLASARAACHSQRVGLQFRVSPFLIVVSMPLAE